MFDPTQRPPEERRRINVEVTRWLNECLGLNVTDAFCGFKAYRTSALKRFDITDNGYAMPLQVWVQAVAARMKIVEVPVPLIYLDESRAFGGALDDAEYRLAHYRKVFQDALEAGRTCRRQGGVWDDGTPSCGHPRPTAACWWNRPSAPPRAKPSANAARLADWDYDFQGRRAARLREPYPPRDRGPAPADFLRRHGLHALPERARDCRPISQTPLIVTGHQPELFHPGVWVKNFAAGGASPDRAAGSP